MDTLGNFKIKPVLFRMWGTKINHKKTKQTKKECKQDTNMFGRRINHKKAQQKQKKKCKEHMNYSKIKIKLKKIKKNNSNGIPLMPPPNHMNTVRAPTPVPIVITTTHKPEAPTPIIMEQHENKNNILETKEDISSVPSEPEPVEPEPEPIEAIPSPNSINNDIEAEDNVIDIDRSDEQISLNIAPLPTDPCAMNISVISGVVTEDDIIISPKEEKKIVTNSKPQSKNNVTDYEAKPSTNVQTDSCESSFHSEIYNVINHSSVDTFGDENLWIDINNLTDSEVPSPSISSPSNDSTSHKFEYDFTDINIFGAIKMPKDNNKTPMPDLLGNSNDDESSESDSDSFDNDFTPRFTIDTIGHIGVIHTNEYIEKNIINNFVENRKQDIHNDLLDLISSDIDENVDENIDGNNGMDIIELLYKFKIETFIGYFDELSIKYVNQMTNVTPNVIRRGLHSTDIQIMFNVYKMFTYIYNEIINGILNGNKAEKWIELYHNNSVYNIYGYSSNHLIDYKFMNDTMCNNINDSYYDQIIKLQGNAKYTKEMSCTPIEQTVAFTIGELPDKHEFESSLVEFGIELNENIISINDRLQIYHNGDYIAQIGFGSFLENDSYVIMKFQLVDQLFTVNISSDDYNYTKNIEIEMNDTCTIGDVFISQYNGAGEYFVDLA